MRFLWRWIKRVVLGLVLLILALLAPVGHNALFCQGDLLAQDYAPLLPEEHHRREARTLLTYPEWHIVHAYDDYAEVIASGDPHEFGFFRAIRGYWSSLCTLSETAGAHGGMDFETRQMVYVIGVSFTAELAAKALYEETFGRVATWVRGGDRAALDELSATQARGYADFLQQTPWYRWDFAGDAEALGATSEGGFRDRERAFSLGIENSVKAAYAEVIAQAVADIGFDELTLRMIVSDLPESALALPGVTVISETEDGIEIETPRYRELTHLLAEMAQMGGNFVEIAGNDDILFTALSDDPEAQGAIHSFARQGYFDHRHLILLPVSELAETLRGLEAQGLNLEHIHDY